MTPTEVRSVWFSPTRTSRKIAEAIARGTGIERGKAVPLTRAAEGADLPASALAVIAVPVYGGHVAPLAAERLKTVRGADTPAVIAVVYGNRAYGRALRELAALARAQGFRVVAAASFVGEHSYSSDRFPIAPGRPDEADLRRAADFGRAVAAKLASGDSREVDAAKIGRPRQPVGPLLRFMGRVIRLRRSGRPLPSAPWLPSEEACTHCGTCATLCPSGAIVRGDELHTDPAKCIRCCACVKGCPQRARVFETPFAALLSENFSRRKEPRTLL